MNKVQYKVPLNELYEVMASCQYKENADFSPVLLRIVDKDILTLNQDAPFLLQVWSRYGNMVFEKPMMQPCSNWNISENIFIFSEEVNCSTIWLVKLGLEKEPVVFKFMMPNDVIEGQANSKWDDNTKNFLVA